MTLPVSTTHHRRPGGEPSVLTRLAARLAARATASDDRGDVPGWVLVTLMTAALVAGIWALAGDALEGLFQDAIAMVTQR
ncbi:hypothetical protein [Cellulomonas massiliensis]|uniref:hypothetical protein n=1 Tax=Cellulomonas massiliensis TaxID=1465811 RepID=UPI0002F4B828|nr:hypothetical protein [Cellulomonas massiliensis]